MRLRVLILMAIVIPVVFFAANIAIQVKNQLSSAAQAKDLAGIIDLAQRYSNVIHQMQIERGMSVGLISGKYKPEGVTRLNGHRPKVDESSGPHGSTRRRADWI